MKEKQQIMSNKETKVDWLHEKCTETKKKKNGQQ